MMIPPPGGGVHVQNRDGLPSRPYFSANRHRRMTLPPEKREALKGWPGPVWGREFVRRSLIAVASCWLWTAHAENSAATATTPASPRLQPFKDPSDDVVIAFLRKRVAADPDDVTALNRLASEYLRRLRLTGDLTWLPQAAEAAHRSLTAVPAAQNPAGLAARARVEFESHRFLEACASARQLREYAPDKASTFAILGDASLEAGDYGAAAEAYGEMKHQADEDASGGADVPLRFARLAWLQGDDAAARAGLERAVALAEADSQPAPEMVGYCRVQLGQFLFGIGDWPGAEKNYLAALAAQPSNFAAVEHLAELAGARGDVNGAAALFREVLALVPRPEFCQELADLYLFFRQLENARPWLDKALAGYEASMARGESQYDHHLAAFYSDSCESPKEALEWARKDLELRQGVFAQEALGWALYKNGSFAEAAAAMDKATATGCRSTHLLFQAGMVYFRAGNPSKGSEFLRRAHEINPQQDTFHVHR